MIFEQKYHSSPAQNQNRPNFNAQRFRLFGHLQEHSTQFFGPPCSLRD